MSTGSTGPYARYAAPPAANEGYAQGASGYNAGQPAPGYGGAAPGYGGQGGYAAPPGSYGQQQYVDPTFQQVRTAYHVAMGRSMPEGCCWQPCEVAC